MDDKQTVSIYRDRRSGEVHIQPFGRLSNGTSQPFGQQDHLSATASNSELTTALLKNLAKNDQQTYDESAVPKVSHEEQTKVFKERQLISVYRSGRQYRIVPFRRMGNSFGSIDDMIQVVSKEDFVQRAGEIVRELFEEIS